MAVVVFLTCLFAVIICFFLGFIVGAGRQVKNELRKAGLTRDTVKLYRESAKILQDLINLTELEGDFGTNLLSNPTRKRIEDWLQKYRKEFGA